MIRNSMFNCFNTAYNNQQAAKKKAPQQAVSFQGTLIADKYVQAQIDKDRKDSDSSSHAKWAVNDFDYLKYIVEECAGKNYVLRMTAGQERKTSLGSLTYRNCHIESKRSQDDRWDSEAGIMMPFYDSTTMQNVAHLISYAVVPTRLDDLIDNKKVIADDETKEKLADTISYRNDNSLDPRDKRHPSILLLRTLEHAKNELSDGLKIKLEVDEKDDRKIVLNFLSEGGRSKGKYVLDTERFKIADKDRYVDPNLGYNGLSSIFKHTKDEITDRIITVC